MSVITSPKSLATRGRLINVEGGSVLQPAILLEARTRGKLSARILSKRKATHSIIEPRAMKINATREIKYVG